MRITVDVFSGRPNPQWRIDDPAQVADLLRAFTARSAALGQPDAGYQGLGFRGIEVELEADVQAPALPRRFTVAAGGSRDEAGGRQLAERLLTTMPDRLTTVPPESGPSLDPAALRRLVHNELARRPASPPQRSSGQEGADGRR